MSADRSADLPEWAAVDEAPPDDRAASENGEAGRPEAFLRGLQDDSPTQALEASRVDLIRLIREGIPEREFVPSEVRWLIRGKRYLLPSPAGEGKSLAGLIIGVDVVEAGGTVAIIDVENGGDEYARRLSDVLDARDRDGELATACSEWLRYYAWPALSVDWGADEWTGALDGVDLAIFDSSRLILSASGLSEDSNDDYARFANALLIPLSRVGVTTAIFDNTGHENEDRARGASAKRDLNEAVYAAKVGQAFDRDQSGSLRLIRARTRFTELPAELHIPIGGGVYGPTREGPPPEDPDKPSFRPTTLMERISEAIELEPGMSTNEALGVSGKKDAKQRGLRLLVEGGYVRVQQDGQARRHFNERLYRASEDPKVDAEDD